MSSSSPLFVILLLALPACAGPALRPLPLEPTEGPRLRPGDGVRVTIADERELSGEFAVDESGAVLLPMVGLVQVAERPFPEVRAELLSAYGRELVTRDITVVPVLRIAVLGEVRQPGLVAVDPTLTVAEVMAAAGGWTPTARRDRVLLSRGGDAWVLELGGGGGDRKGLLRSGDRLEVGRRSWMSENLGIVVGASASVLAAAVTSLLLR